MNIRRLWLLLALLLCAVTVIATTLPSSLAYIAANSNTVRNTFRVEYLPPQDITVPVRVHKTVLCMGEENISPGGFSFCLMNLSTGEVTAMTSSIDGWGSATLTFTAEDVGNTYCYRLYEIDQGQQHFTYDKTIYDINITLTLDEQHEMTAGFTLNGEPVPEIVAEFVNLYTPITIPDTGDHDQPLLWLAMLLFSSVGLVLLRKKATIGRRPLWIRRQSAY